MCSQAHEVCRLFYLKKYYNILGHGLHVHGCEIFLYDWPSPFSLWIRVSTESGFYDSSLHPVFSLLKYSTHLYLQLPAVSKVQKHWQMDQNNDLQDLQQILVT